MPVIMKFTNGVVYENDKGKNVTLLNQSGKIGKYSHELKTNRRYTNTGDLKVDKNGEAQELTKAQRAYRAGYLTATKDTAKVYKKKHPKYQRKTKTHRGTNYISFPQKSGQSYYD